MKSSPPTASYAPRTVSWSLSVTRSTGSLRVPIEVLGLEHLEDVVQGGVVEQDAAQDAPLGVQVLRRHPARRHRDGYRTDRFQRSTRAHAGTLARDPDINLRAAQGRRTPASRR